jgi:Zn-dependent protease
MLLSNSNGILEMITLIPAILLALTFHEYAHAWTAWKLGDNTAKMMGRVSMNPFVHLDLLGSLVMVLTGFIGWAKPVPVNDRNFKNSYKDMALVALAGPMANVLLASIFAFILMIVFNKPEWVLKFPSSIHYPLITLIIRCLVLNIAFAVLNLIPVPPLDGFKVISFFLSTKAIIFFYRYQLFFMLGLILFIWIGPFRYIVDSIVTFIFNFYK